MSGYYGYSMSNNALAAYECGERPISKWTKNDIINVLADEGICSEKLDLIMKASTNSCKKLLHRSSWHHTSSYYNQTDFYEVDVYTVTFKSLDELKALLTDEPKQKPKERKAICSYLVWSGTRKHPKATEQTSNGIIKGNWFYLPDGTKKNINANGFNIIQFL